ncbi:hypothetical protein [Faucicola atlantae]|nr:hypothetical protein [Moraxella atlantae]
MRLDHYQLPQHRNQFAKLNAKKPARLDPNHITTAWQKQCVIWL